MTETAADEQDLAKALDSVANGDSAYGSGVPATATPPTITSTHSSGLSFEETTQAGGAVASPFTVADPVTPPHLVVDEPEPETVVEPNASSMSSNSDQSAGPLESIKKDALVELRPLVDKLNVSPEEKFDTYLLLIRSTDDKDLIGPAHEAAKAIPDETRRAEALLDIIKEIDYLTHPKTA